MVKVLRQHGQEYPPDVDGLIFAARLRAQVDLDALSAELVAVAEDTVAPTRASLWLRPPASPSVLRPHASEKSGLPSVNPKPRVL